MQSAIFGGGCFWCTEAVFKQLKGVKSVTSGYAGGIKENPTYEEVSSGSTGHAEVIKIEFDSAETSFDDLLTVFFATHDSTTLNRQGNDVGTQYRSIILYTSPEQEKEANKFIADLNQSGEKIVTEVKSLEKFYEAESYHKDFYVRNKDKPYCQLIISPKLEKLKEKFYMLLKN
ncbi:MAG: peptide-methionine (S)-S-oxide reductase MsrA [bacterium]|nr:peptide-methionine (S)-S-oxide reductase MsrA [bacterium]